MPDYQKEDFSRLAKLRQQILDKASKLESEKPENDQGFLGDSVDALQQGLFSGAADMAEGVHYLLGSDSAGEAANYLRGKADEQVQQMSPEGRNAFQNFGVESDDSSMTGYGFKDGSSLRGFGLNVLAGVGSFAPTMIPGTGIAKGIGLAGKAAGAIGKGEKVAKAADKVADVVGYGAAGSVAIAGSTANQAYQKIMNTDFNTLKDSEIFQQEYWKLRDKNGLDHEQALKQAREDIAKNIANEAAKDGAILGAITQGALGPIFGKILRGESGGRARAAAMGALGEGAQEMVESGGQTYASNVAVNPAVPTNAMDGVIGDAITGGITGGPAGGVFGAAGHGIDRKPKQKEEQIPASPKEQMLNDIDTKLSDIESALDGHESLSDEEFSNLVARRETLLKERSNLIGDQPSPDNQSFNMAGPDSQPEPLALPNQNIIYGDKPELTQEQIQARENNQAAFEGQFGEPRINESQNAVLENEQTEKTAPESASKQSSQQSRKNDPLYQKIKRKQREVETRNLSQVEADQPTATPESIPSKDNEETNIEEQPPALPPEKVETANQEQQAPAPENEKSNNDAINEQIDKAATETNPNPTEKQIEADNYKKGRVSLHGLDIAIENPKDSVRSGQDSDGKKWESKMAHHYGDIKGVKGADGDNLDVFVGDKPQSDKAYIVDQVDPKTGKFDEHKVMLGFDDKAQAESGYLANYEDGWKGVGAITEMPVNDLKEWIKTGDTTQPVSGLVKNNNQATALDQKEAIPKLSKLGKPFKTEFSARLSRTFKDTPNAEIVPVDGGFGVKEVIKGGKQKETVSPVKPNAQPIIKDSTKKLDEGPEEKTVKVQDSTQTDPKTLLKLSSTVKDDNKANFKGMEVDQVQKVVDGFLKEYNGNIPLKFRIEKTQEELYGPDATVKNVGRIYGAYHPKEQQFVLAASNLQDDGAIRKTLRHEIIGHYGLNVLEPKDKALLLEKITASRSAPSLKSAWENVDKNYTDAPKNVQAEEVFAFIAENEPKGLESLYNQILSTLNKGLRKVGLSKQSISRSELRALAQRIGNQIKAGEGQKVFPKDDSSSFSKETAKPTHKSIKETLTPLINQLHEQNTFEVVQSINDLPFAVRLMVKKQLSQSKGEKATLRGVNAGDKSYLIADGIKDKKEAVSIFLHEVVGHKAVLDMLGKEGDSIMERIAYSYGPKQLQDLINAYGADFKTKEGRILLGKEKVAQMAEKNEKPSLLGKLVANVKAWLRKFFPNIKWSDNDIKHMLATARNRVENRYMVTVDLDAPKSEHETSKNKVNLSIKKEVPEDIDRIIDDTQAKPKSQETLLEKTKDYAKKIGDIDLTLIKQEFIDSYAAIEALEKETNAGKLLDGQESAYKAALRTANLSSVMEVMMRKGALEIKDGAFQIKDGTKGLLDIFQPIADADQMRLWETWAGAKRAKRIMQEDMATNSKGIEEMREHRAMVAKLKKTPPSEYKGGLSQWQSDMRAAKKGLEVAKSMATQKRERNYTAAQINRVQSYVESHPKLKESFDAAHKEWADFNKSVLDMAEQAGLIDPEARKIWENDDYVPFHRVSEAQEGNGFSLFKRKKGLSGQKSGIERLNGGVEKLNILESMVRNTTHMVDASFKNVAMQRIAKMADGVAMEKLPATKLDLEETKAMLKEMGYEPDTMDSDTLKIWSKQLERYQNAGKGTVSVSNNGQVERYQVTDPTLFRAITQLGPMQIDGLLKVLGVPKKALTTLVTASPGFMSANFIRDSLSTWVTVDAKTAPFYDALKGAAKSLKHSDSQWAMMAAGAGGGGYYDTAPESVRQHLSTLEKGGALHKPKQLWDAWMRIGHASENANRIAVYDAILKEGGTVAEAAHQAQDVINFSKRGANKWVQAAITLIPFLNARIQGLERLYRGAKENPKAFFLKGSIIMGAGLALLAANWDNEEYWDLPEWDRDANWHAWIDGKHIRIPKPFEVGAFFGTVPERAFEQLRKDADGKLFGERMLSMITNTFAFNPLAIQVIKPAIDVAMNENGFTGNPILSTSDQYRLPEGQYSPWTSETMKQIADSMPKSAPDWMRSPKRLEYLFKGYFGTLGGYALALSDVGTEAIVGVPTKPTMNVSQLPVVKRFYKDGVESNKHIGRFYEMLNEVSKLNAEIKAKMKEHQIEAAKKLKMSNLKKLQLRTKINRVAKELSTINARIKSVYMNKSMTANQKRELIDKLSIKRNEIASDVSMRYYETFR